MPAELERFVCTIPGDPGMAATNKRLAPTIIKGKPAIVRRASRKGWPSSARLCLRAAARGRSFVAGPLSVSLRIYAPRKHRQGPAVGLGFLDVDAPIKATLDALQAAGVIGDDAQIVALAARKFHDAAHPRIEIEVVRA